MSVRGRAGARVTMGTKVTATARDRVSARDSTRVKALGLALGLRP